MATVYVLAHRKFAETLAEEGMPGGDLTFQLVCSFDRARCLTAPPGEAAVLVLWEPADEHTLRRIGELATHCSLPLLALAPTDEPQALVDLLEAGAHEALPSRLSPREIVAHLRVLLRRHASLPAAELPEVIEVGGLRIDSRRYEATVGGAALDLTPREFALLRHLAAHAGDACRRADLIEEVWGGEIEERSRSLDVHIGRLRAKIAEAGQPSLQIVTLPAVGYRLVEE